MYNWYIICLLCAFLKLARMKKILFIALTISTLVVVAQKKSNSKIYQSKNKNTVAASPEADGCAAACITIIFSEAAYFIVDALADHHEYLLDNLDTYPEALSFEAMFLVSGGTENRLSVLPRIRGTAGIFSTDLRFNQGSTFNKSSTDQFLEWQIIEFNTFPAKKINLRFGTGLLYNLIDNSAYNEHLLSVETNFFENKVSFLFEGRYAPDYGNLIDIYSEISLNTKIKAIDYKHLKGYITIGGMYQNYYSTKDISGLQVGFQFLVH